MQNSIRQTNSQIHIGIDLDNTIVIYDHIFYRLALKKELITPKTQAQKPVIRAAIRHLSDGNDHWTRLQGLVYSQFMDEAVMADGIEEFFRECFLRSIKISIISHRTLYPAFGDRINLHISARNWLKKKPFFPQFLDEKNIIFTKKLTDKLKQIRLRKCTHFVDDLAEVLLHDKFPTGVIKILYSPKKHRQLPNFKNWHEIKKYIGQITP